MKIFTGILLKFFTAVRISPIFLTFLGILSIFLNTSCTVDLVCFLPESGQVKDPSDADFSDGKLVVLSSPQEVERWCSAFLTVFSYDFEKNSLSFDRIITLDGKIASDVEAQDGVFLVSLKDKVEVQLSGKVQKILKLEGNDIFGLSVGDGVFGVSFGYGEVEKIKLFSLSGDFAGEITFVLRDFAVGSTAVLGVDEEGTAHFFSLDGTFLGTWTGEVKIRSVFWRDETFFAIATWQSSVSLFVLPETCPVACSKALAIDGDERKILDMIWVDDEKFFILTSDSENRKKVYLVSMTGVLDSKDVFVSDISGFLEVEFVGGGKEDVSGRGEEKKNDKGEGKDGEGGDEDIPDEEKPVQIEIEVPGRKISPSSGDILVVMYSVEGERINIIRVGAWRSW